MWVITKDALEPLTEIPEVTPEDFCGPIQVEVKNFSISSGKILKKYGLNELVKNNHPKSQAFTDWLLYDPENKLEYPNHEWCIQNRDKIKLVDDGIKVLWDIFCLEDENAPDWEDIFNKSWNTYFTIDSAEKYAELHWKRLPEWEKYIDFLPWNNKNKIEFLTKVLWLKFAGTHFNPNCNRAFYWSHFIKNHINPCNLSFTTTSILSGFPNVKENRFSLRLIKN